MATSVNWPPELPQQFLVDSYSEDRKNNLIRTQIDAAVAKQRRRFSVIGNDLSGNMLLTAAQKVIFETFFIETLKEGALEFNMPIVGDNNTTRLVRFMGDPPKLSPRTPYWILSIKLEALPE